MTLCSIQANTKANGISPTWPDSIFNACVNNGIIVSGRVYNGNSEQLQVVWNQTKKSPFTQ